MSHNHQRRVICSVFTGKRKKFAYRSKCADRKQGNFNPCYLKWNNQGHILCGKMCRAGGRLFLWCFVSNLMDTSAMQLYSQVLDMSPTYHRLLKRMTEIERELNLHLNYNFTTSSSKDNFLESRLSDVAAEVLRDETPKTDMSKPSKGNDLINHVNLGENIPVDTCKSCKQRYNKAMTRYRRKLPVLNLRSKGLPPTSVYIDLSKHPENHRVPHPHRMPQSSHQSPPCVIDTKCGCCKRKKIISHVVMYPYKQRGP